MLVEGLSEQHDLVEVGLEIAKGLGDFYLYEFVAVGYGFDIEVLFAFLQF